MFKKLITILLVISMITCTFAQNVIADTPEENIKQSKAKYDELNTEILDLNNKLSSINIEIQELNTKLAENESQITSTEAEIENNKALIKETEEEIDKNQKILDGRVRGMYKSNASSNYLVGILTSESIFDLLKQIQSISKIVSMDKTVLSTIETKKEELNTTVETLNKKQAELITLKETTENNLKLVQDKQKEAKVYLDQLEDEKASVFSVIEANEYKLVEYPISIINSSTSASDIQNSINTLNGLLPQLNSQNVIDSVNAAIADGQAKVNAMTNPTPSRGESTSSSNQSALLTLTMESTAYTGGTLTAMGLKPVRNPDGISTIAVDPNVIPLGSKVYVHGYGTAIASDTGGAIKGNIIDVYFNSYSECIAWGRRNVTVDILAYPNEG